MQQHQTIRSAPQLAAISFVVLFGCARGDVLTEDVSSHGRGRPPHQVDSGAPLADSGARDAAVVIADSGRDSGARDTGTDAATARDSGTDSGTTITTDAGTSTVWRPFADTSPWNTRIAAGVAIRPDSAALIDSLRTSSAYPGLHVSIYPWSVPMYDVDSRVPLVPVYADLSNEGQPHTFMWPVPTFAEPAPESDGHLLLVDRATGHGYDFYQARHRSDGAWDCTLCATSDLTGSGVRPPKGGPTPWYESHGSRACGFPLSAGLIRVEEIRAGHIDHALVLLYPGIRQRYFTSPASTGHPANGIVSPDWGIPCGGHVQLDPSLDLSTLPLSPAARTIARALQQYGAYVGDFSGSVDMSADGSPDARAAWSSGGLLSTDDLSSLPLDRLRVLEWGTLLSDG